MPEFYDHPRDVEIHSYDDNGAYVGSRIKTIPPGVGLPRNSTEVAPPPYGPGTVPVFADGAWTVVTDRRGEKLFDDDNNEVEIKAPGEPPPNLTQDRKPEPVTAARLRRHVYALIETEARSRGFESILDACSFADVMSDTTRQPVAAALKQWRSDCLAVVDVEVARPQLPSIQAVLARLPAAP